MNKIINKIQETIENGMWSVVAIPDGYPTFAYTVGLWKMFKHPEIIVYGLPVHIARSFLNQFGNSIKEKSDRFMVDNIYHYLAGNGMKTMFKKVRDKSDFGACLAFYGGDFEAIQMVWPDTQNNFPWEDGFEAKFYNMQKVIW